MTFPTTPDAITVDWLNENLPAALLQGETVTAMSSTNIGEGTGIFGEIVRLHVTTSGHDGDSPPWSVVAKMPCTEPANLEIAKVLGIYERELNMFDHVVPKSPLRAPEVHVAERDDEGQFLLVLEDLSTSYTVGDQVVGTTLAEAEAIVDALAELHAQWWESPELAAMDWLPVPDAPQYLAAVPGIYRAGLPVLQADWADRVSDEAIDLATRIEPVFEEILERTGQGPETLIHGDPRLDNFFFANDDSGAVAVIDFQLSLRGRGVADIAYLIGTSVPRDIAQQNWEGLLQRWHQAITASGVSGYRFDDALTHYREAVAYYFCGPLSLVGTFDASNERGAAMTEAYTTRMLEHGVDINAAQIL